MKFSTCLLSIFRFAAITAVFALIGCSTAPSEPAADPEPSPPPAVKESESGLTQAEIDAARDAVQRANRIGANDYHPQEYRDLAAQLSQAIDLGGSDTEAARDDLLAVIDTANALYDRTVETRINEYLANYERADKALLGIEADRFAPPEYAVILDMAQKTEVMISSAVENTATDESIETALASGFKTLEAQTTLYYNLNENIRYVNILKRDTENYLGDAEDNEAYIYAPSELEMANGFYFDGISAFRGYRLQESADTLTEAKRQAVMAARVSAVRKQQAETDALLTSTQQRLESASRLQATNSETGELIQPDPWNGGPYLVENPLLDHADNIAPADNIEDVMLRDLDAPVESARDGVPEDIPIENAGTQVNSDHMETDYLGMAAELWEKGVQARNDAEFSLAQDFFRQSLAYIDAYEANVISKTYTVVRRDVATDCLWRISEREDIFANPFLWPKLWRANRKIIQNPDLIYPGQVLVVPPQ